VQGLQGAFCSPPCASNACPADLPSGVTASPSCALSSPAGGKFCALMCSPSAIRSNGANGECGSGSCQALQGLGLCTYSETAALGEALAVKLLPAPEATVVAVSANPTHYGDPKSGCESDEQAVRVQGLQGAFCSPPCASNACPADLPSGVTASPSCALSSPAGGKFCALMCSPSAIRSNGANGECGSGSCQALQGLGLCTYSETAALGEVDMMLEPAVNVIIL